MKNQPGVDSDSIRSQFGVDSGSIRSPFVVDSVGADRRNEQTNERNETNEGNFPSVVRRTDFSEQCSVYLFLYCIA